MAADLSHLSAAEIARLVRTRALSCREVAQGFLDGASLDQKIGAFLRLDPETTLAEADRAQEMVDAGVGGPLAGVPVAVKDNLSTEGIETTCASRILEGYIPPYDATVVTKLREAGAFVFGKTNLDEFAMGTSGENSAYRTTKNPWDLSRTPGGSSAGSAAAVAAGLAPVSLGSDTGGSIRMPAALCGVVGFKPTYGRASRYGLVAFGSSLDQVGPFARSVEDTALLAGAITGHDENDSTSLPSAPITFSADGSLRGKRIGVPQELMGEGIDAGVRARVEEALETLRQEGATVETISLPSIALGVSTYYILAPAEASSNLARFDGVRYGPRIEGEGHIGTVARTRGRLFGSEVKLRIMVGTYVLSAGYYDAYYTKALAVRERMKEEFLAALDSYDFIASPASPLPAFPLGSLSNDPLALKLLDFCTIPANLGGFPAISIPCGFTEGLPVGLQLLAAPGEDEALLSSAHAAERALPPIGRPSP